MNETILVAYASKYGATAEIARKIGEVLRQSGLHADVAPVESIRDVRDYRAVILGSALYVGKWQKSAETFLKAREKDLSERPVWIFSSGPTGEGDPVKLVDGKKLPAALQPVVERIRPRDVTVFHGHIDTQKINAIEKWAVKSVVKKPFGDFRNWEMITDWAAAIAGAVKNGGTSV